MLHLTTQSPARMDYVQPPNLLLFVFFVSFVAFSQIAANEDEKDGGAKDMEGQGSGLVFYRPHEHPRDCSEVFDYCSSSVASGVYLIKPDGYKQPFEAYCDKDDGSRCWTVIQRHLGGFVDFQRDWTDYKEGFGFLSTDFWLGNDKLSFLTNQAVYELRIDITLENGTSCQVKHNAFRISDEWSNYTVTNVGSYEGDEACKWVEGSKGDTDQRNLINRSVNFTDCNDVYNAGFTRAGIYFICPTRWNRPPFRVFCNMSIDGGSWTVIQRRVNGSTDFYMNWNEYREGFGTIQNDFWLGNEKLYFLTTQATYEYRIDFESVWYPSPNYNKHTSFRIDDEIKKYRVIELGSWMGTGGYCLNDTLNKGFSTYDQDNDQQHYNCAEGHRSGWWHGGFYNVHTNNCAYFQDGSNRVSCSYNNPNGDYNGVNGEKHFAAYVDCTVKYTEMKIRRVS